MVQDFSCKVQVYFALTFFIQWIAIGLVKANFYEIRLAGGYKGAIMVAIIGLLSVLIYAGIKIILSSTAGDKAKYK
ncbi:MAG: hypothetical protein UHM56_09685, partial [Phascolarctobacterium sp.]|nr:hypothetical protein [Phascolarctobacterium sp.]